MSRNHDPFPGYTHVWDQRPIGDGTFTIICVPSREAIMPLGPNERSKIPDPPKPAARPETRREVPAKKPAEKPTTKVTEKPGRKRPGGRARPVRKPAPPRVSAPRPTRSRPAGRPWTPAIAVAVALLVTVGIAGSHAAAILELVGFGLTVLALVGIIGSAVGVAVIEGLDWSTVRPWWERRRQARAAVEARRTEVAQVIAADAAPIALGPATTPVTRQLPVTDQVTEQLAVDPEVRKWTDPNRAVPDRFHLYRARTGRNAR